MKHRLTSKRLTTLDDHIQTEAHTDFFEQSKVGQFKPLLNPFSSVQKTAFPARLEQLSKLQAASVNLQGPNNKQNNICADSCLSM
ncbi:MAG: hypothetical protein MRJ92_04275 [Nitrospira sp.]|nr:hypothetical protein [Nitrospira sp.]